MGKQLALTVKQRQLPDGYTQLEYIESSGSQYVDTGVAYDSSNEYVIETEATCDAGSYFGWDGGGQIGSNSSGYWHSGSSSAVSTVLSNAFTNLVFTIEAGPSSNSVLEIDQNGTTATVTRAHGSIASYATGNYPLFAVSSKKSGTFGSYAAMKAKYVRVKVNGTLVRDFVPCINESGVVGLYDLSSKKFYGDAAGGAFTAGAEVETTPSTELTHLIGKKLYITDDSLVYRKAKKAYLTVPNFTKRDLPDGYTQVEYIESSGTQYIDTGFTPNSNSRMVLDFAATDVSGTNNIAGSRNSTTSKAFTFSTTSGNWRIGYNTSSPQTSVSADTARHTADLNKNVLSLDGEVIYTATEATFTGYASIYIGAIHASGTGYMGYAKFYSCRIYDNDTLIRDYVPCVNASGAAGLYDLANDTFYQNAGSGTFTAGSTFMLVHRLCFSGGVDVAALGITYTGTMQDAGVVTMTDGEYRLLTLTSSGTLTVEEDVEAEVWMCGGGTSGASGTFRGGGAGAFTKSGAVTLSSGMAAVIGAGGATASMNNRANLGGSTSFGGMATSTDFSVITTAGGYGYSGGTGGGANGMTAGTGDGLTKYPFGDSGYFTKCHCAGGGGGGRFAAVNNSISVTGGDGGTNGGNGRAGGDDGNAGGAGGSYGGGAGGTGTNSNSSNPGSAASFYGSAGGGGGSYSTTAFVYIGTGGAGYQGVIYIRIPVEESGGGSVTPTLISFTVTDSFGVTTTYTAEQGMTWQEWVDTAYNNGSDKIAIKENYVELQDDYVRDSSGVYQAPSTKIVAGEAYYIPS